MRYMEPEGEKVEPLTDEEILAIRALQRLAKRWPATLRLFSWSGSLVVQKPPALIGEAYGEAFDGHERYYEVPTIHGIWNDGGDP